VLCLEQKYKEGNKKTGNKKAKMFNLGFEVFINRLGP